MCCCTYIFTIPLGQNWNGPLQVGELMWRFVHSAIAGSAPPSTDRIVNSNIRKRLIPSSVAAFFYGFEKRIEVKARLKLNEPVQMFVR